jgi:uncharacterized protein with ATP-grasp and redox domains
MAAGDNHELQVQAEAVAQVTLDEGKRSNQIAPILANRILRTIKKVTGVADPFADYKIKEMEQSRQSYERIKDRIGDDLYSCLKAAAIGNSLDFFKPPEEAFSELKILIERKDLFHHLDLVRLEDELKKGLGLILYLTDNSGEIYFDLPLYEHLRKRAGRVILVVKGGAPAINDLTRADIERAGLAECFDEVADTGTDGAGVDWEWVSPAFMELLEKADLVLCKGGANFETIYPRPFDAPAFFVFKVKCRPDHMDYFESPPEVFWALWREGGGVKRMG